MRRILVVDDDSDVRAALQLWLRRAGYEVETAENGGVALEHQRIAPADVIIIDILMPDKDGVETILALRRDAPQAKIIAISGGGRISPDLYLDTAAIIGAHRTLLKPFALEHLLQLVRELLGE